ncbi:MAG: hypothetical protein Tsb009_23430 [Planctomycetaceae bacterium]
MTTIAQRMKASEKQAICKKLTAALKKRYKSSLPKTDRPVLETILFGICLEDVPYSSAEAAYNRLFSDFHDLNEVRVSSFSELEQVFDSCTNPEWRSLRVRNTLYYVFEKQFAYDFEILRKKTQDLAAKELAKIDGLSSFVKTYTLQAALGNHVVPVDQMMTNAAIWLGLVDPGSTPEKASDALKPALRKSDTPLFCHLLRCFATDSALIRAIESHIKKAPEEGFDPNTAVERLTDLFKNPKKGIPRSSSRKKTTKKKTTKKVAKKTAAKKTTAAKRKKKTAPKKKTTKKVAVKKQAAKKKAAPKKKKTSRSR